MYSINNNNLYIVVVLPECNNNIHSFYIWCNDDFICVSLRSIHKYISQCWPAINFEINCGRTIFFRIFFGCTLIWCYDLIILLTLKLYICNKFSHCNMKKKNSRWWKKFLVHFAREKFYIFFTWWKRKNSPRKSSPVK